MVYRVVYKSSVERDLKLVDKKVVRRLLDELEGTLSSNPRAGQALRGEFRGLFKLRIGEYRVIHAVLGNEVLVLRISHRSKVYV